MINGSGIFPITGGLFESKAQQHVFKGGEKVEIPKIKLNESPCYLTFEIVDEFGNPGKNIEYIAFRADGSQKIGRTDANGHTEKFETEGPEQIGIHISDQYSSKYKIMQNN